jgi:PPOX class probable F420-dependent enzyme
LRQLLEASLARPAQRLNYRVSWAGLLTVEVASMATSGPDGYPQVTALWFLFDDDGTLKLSLNTARQKVKNLHRHPACTLFLLDPANPYRTLEVRARAAMTPDPAYVFATHRRHCIPVCCLDVSGRRGLYLCTTQRNRRTWLRTGWLLPVARLAADAQCGADRI